MLTSKQKVKKYKQAIKTLDAIIVLEVRKLGTLNKMRIALTQEMAKYLETRF